MYDPVASITEYTVMLFDADLNGTAPPVFGLFKEHSYQTSCPSFVALVVEHVAEPRKLGISEAYGPTYAEASPTPDRYGDEA